MHYAVLAHGHCVQEEHACPACLRMHDHAQKLCSNLSSIQWDWILCAAS